MKCFCVPTVIRALTVLVACTTTTIAADLPTLEVSTTDVAIVVEGKLTEPVWQSPPDAHAFTRLGGVEPPAYDTEVRIRRDNTWLYAGFVCHDRNLDELTLTQTVRDDAVHRNDSVEIFISPGTDGATYDHFILAANNLQGDNRARPGRRNVAWDAHWRSGTSVDPDKNRWTAEIAIPLKALMQQAGNKRWRINFCRTRRHGEPEFSAWTTLNSSYHEPDRFGVLDGIAGVSPEDTFRPVLAGAEIRAMVDIPTRAYDLALDIRNNGRGSGVVQASAIDVTAEGRNPTEPKPVRLGPEHQQTVIVTVPYKEYEKRHAVAEIRCEDDMGSWVFDRAITFERNTAPLTVEMDRSFYTGETRGAIICRTALPERTRVRSRVRIRSDAFDDTLEHPLTNVWERVPVNVAAVEPGRYDVTVDVLGPDDAVVDTRTCRLTKLPPVSGGNEVKIDRWNRCVLVDGEPFVPHGFYDLSRQHFALTSDLGINTALQWDRLSREDLIAYVDGAAKHGMYALTSPMPPITMWRKNPATQILEGIEDRLSGALDALARRPGLLAWHIYDEPGREGRSPLRDALATLADELRRRDGYHPVMTGDYMILSKDPVRTGTIDVGFPHHYWLPPGPVSRVPQRYVQVKEEIRDAARILMKPLWMGMVGETHSVTRRMMTERERLLNVYLCLIHEATGVFYFRWPAVHVDTHRSIEKVDRHLKALTPSLVRRSPPQSVTVDGVDRQAVPVLLKRHADGGALLLAANTLNGPVTVSFSATVFRDATAITRMFGDGSPALDNHTFTERVEGYGVRAYRLAGVALPEHEPVTVTVAVRDFPDLSPGEGENLVLNSGFETEEAWQGVPSETGAGRTTETTRSGDYALQLHRETIDGRGPSVMSPVIPVKPNTRYRIGAWFRGEFASARDRWGGPNIYVLDQEARSTGKNLQTYAQRMEDDWRSFDTFLTTDDDTTALRLRITARNGYYKGTAWLDDVFLEEAPIEKSRNLMPNGGFEHATHNGYPDRWRAMPHHRQFLNQQTLTPRPDALVRLDTAEKVQGEHSFRIRGYQWLMSLPTRGNRGVRLKPGTDYVFSIYLKSDIDNYHVRLRGLYTQDWKNIRVGREWQRVILPVRPSKRMPYIHVLIQTLGAYRRGGVPVEPLPTLWADAAQFEKGTEPTEFVSDIYDPSTLRWMALENP